MALTKVTGHVVLPTTNIEFHNTKSTGIVSFTHTSNATSSTTGALQITGGVGIVKDLHVGGNITVGGTITYDDVTNIDSIGIITARNNIHLQDYIYHRGEDPLNSYFGFPADDTIDFFTDGGRRLRIQSSGRIGINTDSARVNGLHIYDKHLAVTEGYPLTWLQPNSNVSRGRMTVDGGGNYLFQFGSGDEEKIRFNSDGEVGIGTNNPQEKLHITDPGNPKILIEDTDSTNQVAVRYKCIGQDWTAGLHGGAASFKISKSTAFGTNDYFTINGDGRVGVGTAGPETNLTIAKNATNQTVATIPTVRLTNLDTTAVATDIVGSYEFFSKDVHSNDKVTGFMRNTPTDAGVNYDLTFGTIKTGDSNAVERLRINSSGQVGIGTAPITGDQQNLTIHGDSNYIAGIRFKQAGVNQYRIMCEGGTGHVYHDTYADGGDFIVRTNSAAGADEKFRITEEGRVGISIDTPDSILDVREENDGGQTKILLWNTDNDNTTTQTTGLFMSPDSRAYAYAGLSVKKENADMSNNAGRDVSLVLNVTQNNSQVEAVHIDSDGDVGIGTNDPNALLHLQSSDARIRWTDSDGAADNKHWDLGSTSANLLRLQAKNDAGGGGGNLFDFYRSGNQITEFRGMKAGAYWFVVNNEDQRVGIGTADPSTLLQIVGSTASVDSTGGTLGVRQKGDSKSDGITLTSSHANSARFWKDSDGALHIYNTGGNPNDFVLTNPGQIGIGTDGPSAAWLDIAATVGTYDHLRLRRISSDSNVASNWSLKPYGNSLYFRHGGNTDKIQFDETAGIRLMGSNQGNHMSTFGSNVGGLRIDDVGHSHTALEVSHGSNKVYVVASSNSNAYFSSYATGNVLFEHTGADAGRGGGREAFRINTHGQISTRGATGPGFNNAGNGDFGSFLTVNGGHTANQWGILSLEGNTSASGYSVGQIQFVNQNNANGSSGGNIQSRMIAKINTYSETTDSNAGDDCGGTLQFFTKPEAGQPKERLTIKGSGYIGINDPGPDRDLQIQNQENAANGGTIRLVNRSTSMNNGQIAGMIEFEQRDANTPGVSATIRSEMQDTTNGNCMLAFQTGTPSTIATRLIMHGSGTITVPIGATKFPAGTTASALVNTSGRQPNSGNDFQTSGSGNKAVGWYTIAVDGGGRSWGRIGIRDTRSSRHQAFTIFAGHHYGGDPNQNSIHAISSGRHSGNPIGAVRIKAYGTYDGAMLQVYLRDADNACQAYLLGDNFQTHGWIMKDWVADGTDPGGLGNFTAIENNAITSAYADLNVLQYGGTSTDGHIIPGRDNVTDLGHTDYRFDDVYATNTDIIGTSDERLKQDIASLTTAEMNAAKRISALFKTFRWKDRVSEKGDKARTHTGVIAQQVKAALEAEGLDFTKYGFIGFNEWYEDSEGTKLQLDSLTRQGDSTPDDDDNNVELGGNTVVPPGFEKKNKYSIRIGELLAFVAAYNEQRFTSIESRLAALESP